MKIFDFWKKPQDKTKKKIIALFYADYPETPYISDDRDRDWIERATTLPKTTLVQRSMMVRFADGLLPGHVYMLHWLKKYTNKSVPAYFEYKYGIDFEKEKAFLFQNGFLNDMNKPTEKGEKAIDKHSKVIDDHAPKRDVSVEGISKQIIAQRDNIRQNGYEEYEFIASRNCSPKCTALNGKHFSISKLKIGTNAPPMHEGCRCSIASYSDNTEYKAWLNHIAKGGTTAEWEKSKKRKK